MMTAKARKLGMTSTIFRNAHGLPNAAQLSTARDMATLGIALREHFPQYYSYFSTRSFTYGKQRIANHNRLLGRVKGVDGIKTGYTRASGFNLVSSVSDGNRRIVAVVMGGQSAKSRDKHMAELIRTYCPRLRPSAAAAIWSPRQARIGNSPIRALAAYAARQERAEAGSSPGRRSRWPGAEKPMRSRQSEEVVATNEPKKATRNRRSRLSSSRPMPSRLPARFGRHRSDQDSFRRRSPAGRSRSRPRRARPRRAPSWPGPPSRPARRLPTRPATPSPSTRTASPTTARVSAASSRRTRLERLQRAEEKENRLLRRPAVGRRRLRVSRNVSCRRRTSRDWRAGRPWLR